MYHNLIDDVFAAQMGEIELACPTMDKNEIVYISYTRGLVERNRVRIALLANYLFD